MKILLTGCAGFIGMHVASRLLNENHIVFGVDNLNDYYDVELKKQRLKLIGGNNQFSFFKKNIDDFDSLNQIFKDTKPEIVINLAAQAGVRYSIENPHSYIKSNIDGFLNILECCRHQKIKHLIYASSSSVYGLNTKMPFSEKETADHPLALYGATKRANELMAHSYSHLYNLKTTGLRFFTVYGPWGRPDMALFKFTKNILEDKEIELFNNGDMVRDFTYVDDIVEGIFRLISYTPSADKNFDHENPNPSTSDKPFKIFNIGNNKPTFLMEYVEEIEKNLGIIAKKKFLPMQMGHVYKTYADCSELKKAVDFNPNTSIAFGIKKFISWYKNYYNIS